MSKSCVGCKWLYGDGSGYSNYTWMNTDIRCALDRNPNLIEDKEEPCDWNQDPEKDNWPPTANSRCVCYSPGKHFTCDPDREDNPKDDPEMDPIVAEVIYKHAGYWS